MKTALFYSSKYGTTKKCTEHIASQIENATIINLDDLVSYDLSAYDQILIGTSIYMGNIRKPIRQFMASNEGKLLHKKLGFYICCNEKTDYLALLPEALKKHASAITHLGFELNTPKMSFVDKFITKKIAGTSEPIKKLNLTQSNELIAAMNKA